MGSRSRTEEIELLVKGNGEFRKPRCEVPIDIRAELQNPASITGCYSDPNMDPTHILEEKED